MLHFQQQMQQTYGHVHILPDGTPFLPSLQNINNPIADQARTGTAVAADTPQQNAQEIAARDQRRAASLWLLMKLAFGVYLFGQNGSIERLVLLHIVALVIFLYVFVYCVVVQSSNDCSFVSCNWTLALTAIVLNVFATLLLGTKLDGSELFAG
jgi:hypothetical protein